MTNDNNQLSLFDCEEPTMETNPAEELNPKECRFKNDKEHRWWMGSRNTHLCNKAYDCTHCHIEHPIELHSNPIRKRGGCAVFYCKFVKSEYANYKFKHKCEITGNEWEATPWNSNEDYNTNPINTPCDFCDLPSCDKCVFRREVSEKNPYGCCSACAHRLYCSSSKYDKSAPLSIKEFLKLASDTKKLDGAVVDFTKGPLKKSYQSSCPYFNGYLCNGSNSQTLCKGADKPIKSDIFRSICETNHEICPVFKSLFEKVKKESGIL